MHIIIISIYKWILLLLRPHTHTHSSITNLATGTNGTPPIKNQEIMLIHAHRVCHLLGGAGIIPGTIGGIPGTSTGVTPGNRPGGPAGNNASPPDTPPPSVFRRLVSGPSSLAEPV